ncbi:MAG TPA: hypothetical protein VEH84_09835 [Alphaproteobacteria bacterium]|nr:hypothetical protein [Alphaproteobacteria bacterium]
MTGTKPSGGTFTEALKSDPHENARLAERLMDSPDRREQEQAMRNKEKAAPEQDGPAGGTGLHIPPD